MARCSGVCPNAPSAFITFASVFHSFVFSSSLKSWSTVVGLVPSNTTRTLSFFFMLHLCRCHSERSEAESRNSREHLQSFAMGSLDFARHDGLLRALEFAGEKIIHHQCRDESGDTKILLRIVIQYMQSKFITSAGQPS